MKETDLPLILITGNQSGDLDSLVCAYVKMKIEGNRKEIPSRVLCLFNFPKEEWHLRTEAVFLFENFNLSFENVLFSDDLESLNLNSLYEKELLSIILVDHNKPENLFLPYYKSIIEIIDHHRKSFEYDLDIPITIEKTGSCSTLIGEQFLNQSINENNKNLAGLLYATIKLDTENLKNNPQYDLTKDHDVLNKLSNYCRVNEELLRKIIYKKYDTSKFSIHDHLVKDFKDWHYKEIHYGISTVYLDIKDFFGLPHNVKRNIIKFVSEKKLDILFLMHFRKDPILKRELTIIFNETFQCDNKLIQLIESSEIFQQDRNKELTELPFYFYSQSKPEFSRKQIQPLIEEFLKELKD